MFSHEPSDYTCPFCDWLNGNETDYKRNSDIVYEDKETVAFIAPKWWVNNPGHVIVIPRVHYENIYSIPETSYAKVGQTVQRVAVAMRSTYQCTGISTRQHNEPDGNQDVWHLHVHVFPRHVGDKLYENHQDKRFVSPEERVPYAQTLKTYFQKNNP